MRGERACILCGRSGGFSRIYARGRFALVRCPTCGLVFQDPQPPDEVLDASYYHDPEFARRLEEGDLRAIAVSRAREKLHFLSEAGVQPGGRALDVGCSSGEWLDVARDAGWDPVGVEIGEHAAAAAARRGFEVHTGTLDSAEAALSGRGFALVTFWDVLEHLRDPLDALRRAAGLLAPGGRVALTFPNVAGWYPRLTYSLLARRTGVWEYPELPVHLFDFSPDTADRLLTRAGLATERLTTAPVPFSFYRATTLHDQLANRGARGRVLLWAFATLRLATYPVARAFDRGNAMFVLARANEVRP